MAGYKVKVEKACLLDGFKAKPQPAAKHVDDRPRIKTSYSGQLFSKVNRRGEILAWHKTRMGRPAGPYARTTPPESAARRSVRLRAAWWSRNNRARVGDNGGLDEIPTTEVNWGEPPNLRWGDEEEALGVDATPSIVRP